MKKIALIGGEHIRYSLSPIIHNFWIKQYDINSKYDIIPQNNLSSVLFNDLIYNQHYIGFNITNPFKEQALQYIDYYSDTVRHIKALNTLHSNQYKLFGENTDHYGFSASFKKFQNFSFQNKNVILLGAGGSAKAIIYALTQNNVNKIFIYNRTLEKVVNLKKNYKQIEYLHLENLVSYLQKCNIIINTIPYTSNILKTVIQNLSILPNDSIVCDITYIPEIYTPLLKKASEQHNPIINGLEMLIHQAIPAFYLWFGIKPQISINLLKSIMHNMCNKITL